MERKKAGGILPGYKRAVTPLWLWGSEGTEVFLFIVMFLYLRVHVLCFSSFECFELLYLDLDTI